MENNLSLEKLPNAVFELYEKLTNIEKLILSKNSQLEGDQLLTIKETGEFLHLSVPTLYGYVSRNEIPFSKKQKRLYFSKQELTEWIHTGRKKTIKELASEANTYLKKKRG